MSYTSALETCSSEVRRGVEWLRSNVDVDKADITDAEVFYVLKEFDQELVEKYLERARGESFLEPDILMQDPEQCWVLAKLGLNDSSAYVQQLSWIKNEQNREGQIWDSSTHAEVLRTLVLLEPNSDYTEKAVRWFVDHMDEYDIWGAVTEIAAGVLALTELDYERYQPEIYIGIDKLLGYKNGDGGFGGSKTSNITSTSWAIQAISRIEGWRHSSVQEATDWLKQQQNDDGSWTPPHSTTGAVLALISAGEGPKISSAEVEWKEMLG